MEKFINNAPFALVLVFLVIGFVLLIKGADFFVEGSSSVAKRLHVPSIIIGLTIVAMGTSLPETAVSVSASIAGNNELAVSNVVGSNIFNLMVVIGVCAVLATVDVAKETIKRDIPLSLICAGLLMLLGIIGLGDKAGMTLGHLDGLILIVSFAGYIFYMVKIALKASKEGRKVEIEGGSDEDIKLLSVPLSILFIVGGAADVISIYIFIQFFENIPTSLDESAYMDGASYFTIFFKILFPLLKPAIVTVMILKGVGTYNEYYNASLYLSDPKLKTIAISLYTFVGPLGSKYNLICAGVIISLIPALVVFLIFQKQIYSGLTAGAVKG